MSIIFKEIICRDRNHSTTKKLYTEKKKNMVIKSKRLLLRSKTKMVIDNILTRFN